MSKKKLSENDVARMLSNPFYCLKKIDETFVIGHPVMVTEEEFIKAGVQLIKESGAENYIRHLLENLKGRYV